VFLSYKSKFIADTVVRLLLQEKIGDVRHICVRLNPLRSTLHTIELLRSLSAMDL
jgi:hypothetical protein